MSRYHNQQSHISIHFPIFSQIHRSQILKWQARLVPMENRVSEVEQRTKAQPCSRDAAVEFVCVTRVEDPWNHGTIIFHNSWINSYGIIWTTINMDYEQYGREYMDYYGLRWTMNNMDDNMDSYWSLIVINIWNWSWNQHSQSRKIKQPPTFCAENR